MLSCSNTEAEDTVHFRTVPEQIQKVSLFYKPEKCESHVTTSAFSGYVDPANGVTMHPSKVDAILKWNTRVSVTDVQPYMRFANYYGVFIRDHSTVVSPMTSLLKKDVKFQWTPAASV